MADAPPWTAGVHHDGSRLYVSNSLPGAGEVVTITLRVPLDAPVEAIYLRSAPDGNGTHTPMQIARRDSISAWWTAPLAITMPRNDYRFRLLTPHGAYFYTALGISRADAPDWFDFTLLADYPAPVWVHDTVFYQIFPDRFYNSDPDSTIADGAYIRDGFPVRRAAWTDMPLPWEESGNVDFFGGDLRGIVQKLDYLTDLGVNALYLNPIFAAHSNHRYDIIDFLRVDSYLGGDNALIDLRRALDERGMRLMLDITPNHTSWNHPWYENAAQDPANSPTAAYYYFDAETGEAARWAGVNSLIKLNYNSQRLRDIMYRGAGSIFKIWLREPYRIDGWRLDVADTIGRFGMSQLAHEFGRELHAALKADWPQVYLLGEYGFDYSPYLQGDELDAAMNYQGFNTPTQRWLTGYDQGTEHGAPHADTHLLAGAALAEQWQRYLAAVPFALARQQFNQLSNHDVPRALFLADGDKALLRLGAAIQFTFPGVPCIYYGDEIGLTGGIDPDNRRPMPWDKAVWDHELRAYHQTLVNLRRTAPALIDGGYQMLYAADDVLCYQRQSTEQRLIFVGQRGPEPLDSVRIPVRHAGLADGAQLVDVLGERAYTVTDGALTVTDLHCGAPLLLEEQRAQ
jgi:alpha-glucosidase